LKPKQVNQKIHLVEAPRQIFQKRKRNIMARVTLSAMFTSIAGRFGGGVFRNWKGTTVLAVLPDSVANPSTSKQEQARSILSCSSKAWAGLATAVRDGWRAVAAQLSDAWEGYGNQVGSRTLIYPPRGPYTALGALTSVAGLQNSIGEFDCGDATPTAPVGIGNPSIPILGTISGDTAGLVIPWTDPSAWGENATAGFVRVWVKSENGSFHTQLAGAVAAATETLTVTVLTPQGGGHAIAITAGYYRIQLDAVNLEGLRGAPSAIAEFLVEDAV